MHSTENEQPINLDDYKLQNKIGSGSFGKVFKVKDKKTGKTYAAKISFLQIEDNSSQDIQNLFREVSIISKLNHPSVLKFIGYSPINFKQKPKPVIITEFASNGSLDELIQGQSNIILNDTHKLIIIYGIASAMSYLHSHNIIHRDLKPANILLNDSYLPKIADFGLSKFNNPNSATKSTAEYKGTPIYMSPEIWTNQEYSKSVDVYAFAMIVYEIMTNEKPFKNCHFWEIPMKLSKGYRPEFKKKIGESYQNLITKCWSKNPSDRPSFDDILDQLTNDTGFITKNVNEDDYRNYIKYIKDYKTTFNSYKFNISINNFINMKKVILEHIRTKIHDDFESKTIIRFKYDFDIQLEEYKKYTSNLKDNPENMFNFAKSLIEGQSLISQDTSIGIIYLLQLIDKGYTEALKYYCKLLIKGDLIPKNHKKVKKLIELKLKNQDEGLYSYLYGKMLKNEKRYPEARTEFEKSINYKNGEAMYEYGRMIMKGYDFTIENKPEKAIEYYKNAIENGSLKAIYQYGLLMKDDESEKYIKTAADKGYIKAIYHCYLNEEDKEKSFDYLKKLAYLGHIESMYKYALKLLELNEKKYLQESLLFLKKAGDKGSIDAIFQYGKIISEYTNNMKEVIKYFRIAANYGNSEAMVKMGLILSEGIHCPADKLEALKYFKMAADNDNEEGYLNYGFMLYDDKGNEMNKEESIKYFKKAVDKGNAQAMNNYGYMLLHGEGIEPNRDEAVKYFKMAIDKGNTDAMQNYSAMLFEEDNSSDDEEFIKYANMTFENCYSIINIDEEGKVLDSDDLMNLGVKYQLGDGVPVNHKEANTYFKMAIYKGNSKAMFYYACNLENGLGTEENKEEAIKYYKMAINESVPEAMYNYGIMLYNGNGVTINKEEAFKYFKMAADEGDSDAMYTYALMINNGEITIDIEKELKYIKAAVDKGNATAMHCYATFLYDGEILPENKEESRKYYKIAADKGYSNSMYSYAYMLIEDDEFPNNKDEVIKYLKLAIDEGNTNAMNCYATLLYDGEYIPKNKQESIKYFKMAADKGDPHETYTNEICMKIEKEKEIKKAADEGDPDKMFSYASMKIKDEDLFDIEESIKYLKMAIDKGNIKAMIYYGNILYEGEIVPQSREESIKYFKMAADEGDSDSMYMYAYMKDEGQGCSIDKEESIKYLKMAIDKGHIMAMNYYASILYEGEITTQNKEELIKYFKIAADEGDINAMYNYAIIKSKGKICPIDIEESVKYLKMAIDKGNTKAMNYYASILHEGKIVPQNKEESIKYFKMAADEGDTNGMYNYAFIMHRNKNEGSININEAIKYYKMAISKGDTKSMCNYGLILCNDNDNKEEALKYFKMAADNGDSEGMYLYTHIQKI